MSIYALSWVLRNSEARNGARLVLIALADFAHDDGSKAFPGVDTLVSHTRLGRTAVKDALKRLVADGLIEEQGRTRSGTAIWRIRMGSDSDARGSESGGNRTQTDPDPSTTHPSSKTNGNGPTSMNEPIGFSEWLGHHHSVTGHTVPRAGTQRRAALAKVFATLLAGHELEDFKLESEGVWASPHMREGGHTQPENVLRLGRFGKYADAGRRARAGDNGKVDPLTGAPLDTSKYAGIG